LTGSLSCEFSDPNNIPDVAVRSYNAAGVATGAAFFITGIPVGNTVTYTAAGVPLIGSFWSLCFDALSPPCELPTYIDATLLVPTVTSGIKSVERYNPLSFEAGFDALKEASTAWSVVGMSLLVTNMQSDLNNGGTCAGAVVPYGTPISLEPSACYETMNQLPYNTYNGPLKYGTFSSYLGEKLQDYFFNDLSSSVPVRHSGGPDLYTACSIPVSGATDDSLNMRVEVKINYEFIVPSRIYTSVVPSMNVNYFNAVIATIRSMQFEASPLVGENPEHFKRIKSIAMKVAKNPTVRRLASDALSLTKGAAKVALPMLLAAL
jgi:hypothetical protein